MSKKKLITEEERALFREAVKHATPLSPSPPTHVSPPKPAPLRYSHKKKSGTMARRAHENPLLEKEPARYVTSVTSEEILQYRKPGIQTRVLRQLQQGGFPIEASLDLHGCSIVQAEKQLHDFLAEALTQHWRCVHIVHGKGKNTNQPPVLKNSLNQELRMYPGVLAFCSAELYEGGTGAVYVLLKQGVDSLEE